VLSAHGSTLVAGSTTQPVMEKQITVKVDRAFMFSGALVPVGAVVDLPAALAWEVIGMGKAVRYVAPVATPKIAAAEDAASEDTPARRGRPLKAKEQET
jgi:hypothetical protein